MNTKLRISTDQSQIVVHAIKELIPSLNKGEVSQFKMAAVKFRDEEIYVDGISMRCAERALLEKASKSEYKLTRLILKNLAGSIEEQREHFQEQFKEQSMKQIFAG